MKNLEKYRGVIPAFYACYDEAGEISPERVQALTEYHIKKGVKGVYVNGSSGECIYQSVEDRKVVLENVMKVAKGKLTVIAHVAANNTKDSVELAKHAESLGSMRLLLFHQFILNCQNIQSQLIGTLLVQVHLILILLFIIFHNLLVLN